MKTEVDGIERKHSWVELKTTREVLVCLYGTHRSKISLERLERESRMVQLG